MSERIRGNKTRELTIEQEGRDSLLRYELIISAGVKYLTPTALLQNRVWIPEDIEATREFLVEAAILAHPKVGPSYWEHLILASIYGRRIAEAVDINELNPMEAEALLLLHDVGRLVIPHRYLRNDLIADRLLARIGVKKELLQKQTNMTGILGLSSITYQGLGDVPLAQRLVDVADNIGKKGSDGQLFNIETMVNYDMAQPTRYKTGIWPSEDAGKKALVEGRQKFATELVLKEIEWLRETFGLNFDRLREEVADEYSHPYHQSFLLALKNSQESLDRNVDRLLGRPPIKAVVFDIGNVLLCGPDGRELDEAFMENVALDLNTTPDNVTQAVTKIVDAGMVGAVGEEENLRLAWQHMGLLPPDSLDELRAPFIQPEVYRPDQTLQRLMHKLSQNADIEIYVLTDGILPLSTVAYNLFQQHYLPLVKDRYLISNEIGARKKDGGSYKVLLDRLSNIDPLSILFVDDGEANTVMFRSQFGGRGLTYRGNPYIGISPQQRLVEEFQKAGLIPVN